MTNQEKRLYHQIHPVKLTIDISAAIISLCFFWNHMLVLGFAIHILAPIIGSLLIMRYANLEYQKASRFGRYLARHMGTFPQAVRIMGDVVTVFGAWYRSALLIMVGLVAIFAAWANGL